MSDPSTTPRSRAWVEVRLDQIRENALAVLRACGPGARLIPMVKADAYGLGMEAVVRTLTGADGFPSPWALGVAAVAEGERLRVLGWRGRVLVFAPALPGEFARAAAAGLTLCLSDLAGVRRWAEVAQSRGEVLPFHLELDTGMGRSGLYWEQAAEAGVAIAAAAEGRLSWEGCYTHFHSADEPDLAATDLQWERFRAALERLPEPARRTLVLHAANSAAAVRRAGFGLPAVRPGIFLYGGRVGADLAPKPVAAVRARLALVREVPAGATLGYGATHTARAPERWGTVSIGYGDGLPRALWPGRGEALVRGRRVRILGRISMDMTTVDLGEVPDARAGDVVTLIGADGSEEITVDEVAARCGTISYEILTGLTPRLPRIYLDGEPDDGAV